MKKTLCASLIASFLSLTAGTAMAADASDWPSRPVQVVVIANAGGQA